MFIILFIVYYLHMVSAGEGESERINTSVLYILQNIPCICIMQYRIKSILNF